MFSPWSPPRHGQQGASARRSQSLNILDDSHLRVLPITDPRATIGTKPTPVKPPSPKRQLFSEGGFVPKREELSMDTPARRAINDGTRDFVVRVLVSNGSQDGSGGDPAFPASVVVSVRATSVRSFAEAIEHELASTHKLHFRISSFQYSPFEGQGPWQSMPTIVDDATAETPSPSPVHSPVHVTVSDTVIGRSGNAAADLALRRQAGASGSPVPYAFEPGSRVSVARRFDSLPPRLAIRISAAARRLSFAVTVLLPLPHPHGTVEMQTGASSHVIQRRAGAVVTTIQSLFRALSAVCYYPLEAQTHRVLFHDDAAGGYRPLSHVAQLGAFSVLLVDLTGVTDYRMDVLADEEWAAARSIPADALNPAAKNYPVDSATFAQELDSAVPQLDAQRALDDAGYGVGIASHPRAPFAAAPFPVETERTVMRLQKPTPSDIIASRMNATAPPASLDDGVSTSLRFRVPARVRTPAAPTDVASTLPSSRQTTVYEGTVLSDARFEELSEFTPTATDLNVPSVLPTPLDNSPAREGLEFTQTALWEGSVRFPRHRAVAGVVRTPVVTGSGPLGPRAVHEFATDQEERRALIHEAMRMVVTHPSKDLFPFATLVSNMSDAVQQFRRDYPQGIKARFPLSRADNATLLAIITDMLNAELQRQVASTTRFAPFQSSPATLRTVERTRLEQQHAAGLPPDRFTPQPEFAVFSPEDAFYAHMSAPSPVAPRNPAAPAAEWQNADTPEHKKLPPTWTASASQPPKIILMRPQYDRRTDTIVFYATTTLDLFGHSSEAIANQRRLAGQLNRSVAQAPSAEASFRWFLCQGGEMRNRGKRTGDVPLDAMIDMGIARIHVLQHTVPITLSLELSLVRRDEGDDVGVWTDALQVGVPYTIGIIARDGEGKSLSALMAFTIPTSFQSKQNRPPGSVRGPTVLSMTDDDGAATADGSAHVTEI
jgi:hypothetical protein